MMLTTSLHSLNLFLCMKYVYKYVKQMKKDEEDFISFIFLILSIIRI